MATHLALPPCDRRCDLRALAVLIVTLSACGPSTPSEGECKAKLLPGDLVITEVFADFKAPAGGTGTDTGKEWIEIYNAKNAAIDLEGLTITHSRPDGSRPNTHTIANATIAAGQFFTLGNASQEFVPAYVDYGYGADLGDLFNTDGGKLALSCGGHEIDSAVYSAVKEGHSRELTGAQPPDYTLNDDQTHWCQANATEFETGNFGTPGSDNDCQPIVSGQCSDRGTLRDVVSPAPGDLVITEVMPSPSKVVDAAGEWFEAKVINDVDLNGVGLDRVGDNNIKPDVITSNDCVHVTAGSYIVFAKLTDPAMNGGIPASAIFGTFRFSMLPGTGAPGDVALLAGTTVIDAVSWTHSTNAKSLQLDPDLLDPISNDTDSNFCDATMTYNGQDFGTPGAANTQCAALPVAGMCDDGGVIRKIVTPAAGQLVISELLANPANVTGFTDAQREWFEVANTGAAAFDLNELLVGRIGKGVKLQSARCIPVRPGGFAVFARSNDPTANSMLPSVAATFSFGLVDTMGDIEISAAAAAGTTVLDTVKWTKVTSGMATQLDPKHLNAADNDNATNFCAATADYGDKTNKGTPGAANTACP